jgi:DUF4097 and DUF4098 domain-containing protein YvlB
MGTRYRAAPGTALKVASASGQIVVTAEDREDFEVDPPDRRVEFSDDGRLMAVHSSSSSLRVRCPAGTNVKVGAMSGSVRLEGTFGSVKVNAVSGSIEVDSALGDVDIRSVSGNVRVGSCGGECSINSKSGRVSIGHVAKGARAATISGSVELGTAGQEDVEVKTISGRVSVQVAESKFPRVRFRTLAGKLHCDCPQGDDFEIRAASVSGSVDIKQS